MYTDSMRRATRSLDTHCPKGFGVEIVDNDQFLSMRINPLLLYNLSADDQKRAAEYIYKLKNALQDNGAIVLLVRKSIDE